MQYFAKYIHIYFATIVFHDIYIMKNNCCLNFFKRNNPHRKTVQKRIACKILENYRVRQTMLGKNIIRKLDVPSDNTWFTFINDVNSHKARSWCYENTHAVRKVPFISSEIKVRVRKITGRCCSKQQTATVTLNKS
jgi:ribosomal protein S18